MYSWSGAGGWGWLMGPPFHPEPPVPPGQPLGASTGSGLLRPPLKTQESRLPALVSTEQTVVDTGGEEPSSAQTIRAGKLRTPRPAGAEVSEEPCGAHRAASEADWRGC